MYCLINGNFSLCPGKLKNIPDSHEHRSQVRHLSQTEVGSVEKEDRSSSQVGAAAIARGTPGSFLSMRHSCKRSETCGPKYGFRFLCRQVCGRSCNGSLAEPSSRLWSPESCHSVAPSLSGKGSLTLLQVTVQSSKNASTAKDTCLAGNFPQHLSFPSWPSP